MRLKKGFTLAEILIVLMVIGAIATMTIPSLMKGVTESQWKTAYKKAYNTVINLCAMERVAGNLPSKPDASNVSRMFESLNSSLAVKDYANVTTDYDDGSIIGSSGYKSGITFSTSTGTTQIGTSTSNGNITYNEGDNSPWIITEDNFAYAVAKGASSDCGTKADINAATTVAEVAQKSCVIVVVDVNGLSNGPNVLETQVSKGITTGSSMATLTGDRYYIYIGKDGAAAGSKSVTATGRITADLK